MNNIVDEFINIQGSYGDNQKWEGSRGMMMAAMI